jgi:hypothetical protein
MTTTMHANGQVKKSLAQQIDRLDGILDGLAEGLNEAVAGAVKEAVGRAVKEAVQAVLAEVLSNPDLLSLLRGTLAPAAAADAQPVMAEAAPIQRKGRLKRAWNWAKGQVQRLGRSLATLGSHLRVVRRFKVEVATAFMIGAGAGVAAYYAGPWLSAAVSGLGAFVGALGVQAGLWLRRTLGTLAAPGA